MKKTIFPRFSNEMSAAFDADPILIDGMKVIFDKPAGLVPVEMEKKQEKPKPKNGRTK